MIHSMIHRNNDHEGVIQANSKEKAQDLVEVVGFRMYQNDRIDSTDKENSPGLALNSNQLSGLSNAEELTKLVKLKS